MGSCAADLVQGKAALATVRRVTTLISITVTSAWFSWMKVKKLSLFFAHWLAGLVAGLGQLVEDAMISSHRIVSLVQSVSSPPLLLVFLVISLGLAAPIIPLAADVAVSGTGFHVLNPDERDREVLLISFFYVKFVVGVCMLLIVAWLLMFRLKEVMECWQIHARIRFYFVLTLIGMAVNLTIGICGTINVLSDDYMHLLITWSWAFGDVHVALDTLVLYGVLRDRSIDERKQVGGRGMVRGSRGSSDKKKPVVFANLL
eukprot:g6328.t1